MDETTQLAVMADDGCPYAADSDDESRAAAGMAHEQLSAHIARVMATVRPTGRDKRHYFGALGTTLVELARGVYAEAGRNPILWRAENCNGLTILTICIDKR
jgi:hypothetical protein